MLTSVRLIQTVPFFTRNLRFRVPVHCVCDGADHVLGNTSTISGVGRMFSLESKLEYLRILINEVFWQFKTDITL